MIKYRGSFYLGVFVFIIPFLGFPTMWKMGLVVFAGVLLVLSSLKVPSGINLSRRIKKTDKKEKTESPVIEVIPTKPEVVVPVTTTPPIVIITPTVKKLSTRSATKVDSVRKPKSKEL